METKAVLYAKEKGAINNTVYQRINGVSERTASRDLESLVEKNIFEQIGKRGKGTEYILSRQSRHQDAINTPSIKSNKGNKKII